MWWTAQRPPSAFLTQGKKERRAKLYSLLATRKVSCSESRHQPSSSLTSRHKSSDFGQVFNLHHRASLLSSISLYFWKDTPLSIRSKLNTLRYAT